MVNKVRGANQNRPAAVAPKATAWLAPCHTNRLEEVAKTSRRGKFALIAVAASLFTLNGCADLVPRDIDSLLIPSVKQSEIVGIVAGFGTTFAAVPDLVAMLRRGKSEGMNPRMAAIMGSFQILWVYYGLLIASRPVIAWNFIAVLTNFLSVGAYAHLVRKERRQRKS